MTYIATFFTHFDAISFSKELRREDFAVRLMPVPRRLSSSCGTCAQFSLPDGADPAAWRRDTMEQLIRVEDETDTLVWDNRM